VSGGTAAGLAGAVPGEPEFNESSGLIGEPARPRAAAVACPLGCDGCWLEKSQVSFSALRSIVASRLRGRGATVVRKRGGAHRRSFEHLYGDYFSGQRIEGFGVDRTCRAGAERRKPLAIGVRRSVIGGLREPGASVLKSAARSARC